MAFFTLKLSKDTLCQTQLLAVIHGKKCGCEHALEFCVTSFYQCCLKNLEKRAVLFILLWNLSHQANASPLFVFCAILLSCTVCKWQKYRYFQWMYRKRLSKKCNVTKRRWMCTWFQGIYAWLTSNILCLLWFNLEDYLLCFKMAFQVQVHMRELEDEFPENFSNKIWQHAA